VNSNVNSTFVNSTFVNSNVNPTFVNSNVNSNADFYGDFLLDLTLM
jgi:hypothetical protein